MPKEKLPIFHIRLLMARKQAQLTQQALAERTGLFKTDISKMERGQMLPTAPRLRRLARGLGVSADFLLGLDEEDEEEAA